VPNPDLTHVPIVVNRLGSEAMLHQDSYNPFRKVCPWAGLCQSTGLGLAHLRVFEPFRARR